ncbi:hypothetical protein DSCO28_36460 [Desulfosarcina ovata subsp. sediminis]|uniref:CHAT domain-containing protein n=1 Tax=Desulfosarcina ovata subsp. sediminis TaxID=885957 RepID=A0A5K7ZS93_9BACT|nr:hypothetical protein DSCO28_36460 [Desulfosarcina ovata subsp. sediminis]
MLNELESSAPTQQCQNLLYKNLKLMHRRYKANVYELIKYEFYCAHYRTYALIETGRFDQAETLCEESIKNLQTIVWYANKNSDSTEKVSRKVLSWLKIYQGFIIWFKTGDKEKVLRMIENVQTDTLSKREQIYVWLYQGFFYDKIIGDYSKAMGSFRKVLDASKALGVMDADAKYAYALQAYRRMMLIDIKLGRLEDGKNIMKEYENLADDVLLKTGKSMFGTTEYFRGYLSMMDTNAGMLYSLLRDFKTAETYFKKAWKRIDSIDPQSKHMWDRNAMGSYYVMYGTYFLGLQNRYTEAAEYIDKGINYLTPYYIESIATEIDIESACMNAAEMYYLLGDKKKALDRLEAAIQYADRYHRKVVASQAFTLKGKICFDQGQYNEAASSYSKALELMKNIESTENWKLYYYSGLLAQKTGGIEKALDYYRKSIQEIEKLWSGRFKDVRRQLSFMENRLVVFEPAIDLMVQQTQFSNAVEYMEKAKSRSFYETTSFYRKDSTSELNSTPMTASEIRKFIPKNMVTIEYYVGEKVAIGCLMTRDRIYAKRLDINAKALGKLVTDMRENITNMGDYADPAIKLYQKIVSPFESRMQDFERICIIPHGVLNYLPFQALVTIPPQKGKEIVTEVSLQRDIQVVARKPHKVFFKAQTGFLIEHYGILYAPSATILKMVHKKNRSHKNRLFAVGSPPQTEQEGIGEIPKLEFAEAEVKDVGRLFSDKLVLFDTQATETVVKDNMQHYDLILFSTHAKMMRTDPFRSFILFDKDSQNDGRLTVSELKHVSLNADLVALSACESGLMAGHKGFSGQSLANLADEKFPPGDDIFGFQRALLQAGASSVISTLWSVADESTRELMVRFFNEFQEQKKIDKVMALRNAQMYLIQEKPEWAHPFFWAPFCVSGDWM